MKFVAANSYMLKRRSNNLIFHLKKLEKQVNKTSRKREIRKIREVIETENRETVEKISEKKLVL